MLYIVFGLIVVAVLALVATAPRKASRTKTKTLRYTQTGRMVGYGEGRRPKDAVRQKIHRTEV